jgi:hypothetical protein
MNEPGPPTFQPSPEQATQIVERLLQLTEKLLERWMSSPASTFQEAALRSLLPQFLPSLQTELRKNPLQVVQVLMFVQLLLGELLADPSGAGAEQLLLVQLAELDRPAA